MGVGDPFYTGGPAADEHEGQKVVSMLAPQSFGFLEAVQHVVAYPHSIRQSFEVEGVLSSPGAEKGRAASRGQDQVVVGEVPVVGVDVSLLEVHPLHIGLKKLYPHRPEHTPYRVGCVA